MAVDKSAWIKACYVPTIYCILLLYMAVESNKNLRKKLNQTQTDAQQNPDILRMECKKHQSRMNVYAGSNDVLYWP